MDSYKPSPLAGVSYLLACFILLSSCSGFTLPSRSEKNADLAGDHVSMELRDYRDHLSNLKKSFLATPGVRAINLDKASEKYLENLITDLVANNEIFFKDLRGGKVTVLDIESPLHFSLPKGEIFVSRGLIAKYIKHESILASILAYELVRSEKMLYPKETFIPVGFLNLEKIVTFNRLSLEEKMEVHKWAHHVTVRSGYDGEYYLSWLQTQNRNTADFIMQVGDANQITREESLFKAFLIKFNIEEINITKKNSSKSFYSFINRVRDQYL